MSHTLPACHRGWKLKKESQQAQQCARTRAPFWCAGCRWVSLNFFILRFRGACVSYSALWDRPGRITEVLQQGLQQKIGTRTSPSTWLPLQLCCLTVVYLENWCGPQLEMPLGDGHLRVSQLTASSALLIQTHLPFLSGEHSSETAEKLSQSKCFNHIPVMLTDVASPNPKVLHRFIPTMQLPQTLSLIWKKHSVVQTLGAMMYLLYYSVLQESFLPPKIKNM